MFQRVIRAPLHFQILASLVLGAAVGIGLNVAHDSGSLSADSLAIFVTVGRELGGLFLRLLQMLVVPLILSSLITGVTSMGDLRALRGLGLRTVGFYLGTSALAILTGLVFVNLVSPGVGAELSMFAEASAGHAAPEVASENTSLGAVLWNQVSSMVPKNPVAAIAEGDMLPIIFFSLLLGIFISLIEHADESESTPEEQSALVENAALLRKLFAGLFAVMMRMTIAVIHLAPIGVFGFVLTATAGHGLSTFVVLGKYALTVALALAFHAFITLPAICAFFGRVSPRAHAGNMAPALLTAFSTASSNGTLPLTMRSVEDSGVSPQVASFVLPLGATINMDGTALYEVVAVLFIAQLYGVDLSLGQQLVVALTALLASVGAAGIPHAGTVMMVVVLSAVGLPTSAVGLILAVDRVLDMGRTTVNVWSDSIAAVVVGRFASTTSKAES